MTRKPFLIVPMILILNSAVLSLDLLYSGPSPYDFRGFDAVWPQLATLFMAIYLAMKLKAKYWGVSIIVLALAGIPRTLIATIPAHTNLLVSVTLALNTISATALVMACRYDTFDLSLWKEAQISRTSRYTKIIIVLLIIATIFIYHGMK